MEGRGGKYTWKSRQYYCCHQNIKGIFFTSDAVMFECKISRCSYDKIFSMYIIIVYDIDFYCLKSKLTFVSNKIMN